MGSHPSAPVKVTDLLINMVQKAASQDQAFLIDLAAIQEKHVKTAKLLLGDGRELNRFVSRLLDDIANLKAMLQAISIGVPAQHGRTSDLGWGTLQPCMRMLHASVLCVQSSAMQQSLPR